MNDRTTPYDASEKRICDYLQDLVQGQIGCGDDPVGFLIASHAIVNYRLSELVKVVRGQVEDRPELRSGELKEIVDLLEVFGL